MTDTCIFCKIIAKEIPTSLICETNDVIVIKDLHPQAPVHYLIIPKKHIQDIQALAPNELSLMGSVVGVAQKLSKDLPKNGDFKFVANSGRQAGQRIFHLHFHFLAGQAQGEISV